MISIRRFCARPCGVSFGATGRVSPTPFHRHHDVFETVPDRTAWFWNWSVQFATGVEGHIESLTVPLEPAVAPIVF